MTGIVDETVQGIAAGDEDWIVMASFLLAGDRHDLQSLFPGRDLTGIGSSDAERQLVDALVNKLDEPTASPTVAFAIGKARHLWRSDLDALVLRLRSSMSDDDEDFAYQALIALDNHGCELESALIADLRGLGSERISRVLESPTK